MMEKSHISEEIVEMNGELMLIVWKIFYEVLSSLLSIAEIIILRVGNIPYSKVFLCI